MKPVTVHRPLFQKKPGGAKHRNIVSAAGSHSGSNLYEEIKIRNGIASVCIIRSVGGIGDVLMTTPVVMQLKREFPQVRITYATDRHRTSHDTYYQLLYNAPFIDEIIDARYIDRSKYDAVVDLSSVCIRYEHSGLPIMNRIDIFARACGISSLRNPLPFYKVEPSESQWADVFLNGYRKNGKKIIFLHTASFDDKRSWTVQNQLDLIQMLANDQVQILVSDFNHILGKLSEPHCIDISFTSVRQMAALISKCDLFIGPDSGPMHIAGALGVRSIVLFGAIPPMARINHYPSHEGLKADGLSCLGCWYKACPYNTRCMKDLNASIVYAALKKKL